MTSILPLSAIGQNGWRTRLSDPVVAQAALGQPATSSLLAFGAGIMFLMRRRRQRGW